MGRDEGGGSGPGRRLRGSELGRFSLRAPSETSAASTVRRGHRGSRASAAPYPPAEGNGLSARAGGCSPGSYLIFSPRVGRFIPDPRAEWSAGWGGQFPGDPPQLGGLTYEVSAPEPKGTLEGPPAPRPRPAVGSAAQPRSGGDPREKPPSRGQCPPDTKAGAGSAGSARLSTPTFASDPRRRICQ